MVITPRRGPPARPNGVRKGRQPPRPWIPEQPPLQRTSHPTRAQRVHHQRCQPQAPAHLE
jgi:hypothetical protein